jgi:hypothetical protein
MAYVLKIEIHLNYMYNSHLTENCFTATTNQLVRSRKLIGVDCENR